MSSVSLSDWCIFSHRHHGHRNRSLDKPCQDALDTHQTDRVIIASVADGHGSPKCFRSDVGSQIAVAVAQFVWSRIFADDDVANDGEQDISLDELPHAIVVQWRRRVLEAVAKFPFSDSELEALQKSHRQQVEVRPLSAYGTTLSTVCITDNRLYVLQIGDGDIIAVSTEGDVRPLVEQDDLAYEFVHSLSGDDAETNFQFGCHDLTTSVALLMLSTDGYRKSYPSDEAFLDVGAQYLDRIRKHGLVMVSDSIPDWIAKTTDDRSRDDTTVAVVCRVDL
jgi:serine/threonine protein phosphatase PrpC